MTGSKIGRTTRCRHLADLRRGVAGGPRRQAGCKRQFRYYQNADGQIVETPLSEAGVYISNFDEILFIW
jgi:hypothetical protein